MEYNIVAGIIASLALGVSIVFAFIITVNLTDKDHRFEASPLILPMILCFCIAVLNPVKSSTTYKDAINVVRTNGCTMVICVSNELYSTKDLAFYYIPTNFIKERSITQKSLFGTTCYRKKELVIKDE